MSFEDMLCLMTNVKAYYHIKFKYFCDACECIPFAVLDVCFTVLSSLT